MTPLTKLLNSLGLCERFQSFAAPDITHFTAQKWIARETGQLFSEWQVKTARKELGCPPKHGGKRPGKIRKSQLYVRRGKAF